MTRFLLFVPICLVGACDIQDDRPDFRYPAASDASGMDWPELAVTNELIAAGAAATKDTETRQAEADRLAARAAALRARARVLRASQGR